MPDDEESKAEESESTPSGNTELSMARSSFNDFVVELLRFKAINGHCRVPPSSDGGDLFLALWVDRIRKEYKNLLPKNRSLSGKTSTDSHENEGVVSSEQSIDLVIGDQGIFFANASGRGKDSNVNFVSENVRLELEGPNQFDRIKMLSSMGMEWESNDNDHDAHHDTGETSTTVPEKDNEGKIDDGES